MDLQLSIAIINLAPMIDLSFVDIFIRVSSSLLFFLLSSSAAAFIKTALTLDLILMAGYAPQQVDSHEDMIVSFFIQVATMCPLIISSTMVSIQGNNTNVCDS